MPFPFPFTMYGASRASNVPAGETCDFTYCYGGDWVQGKVGNYGLFFPGDINGDVEWVSTPSTPDIEFSDSDDFTVACWVKADNSINDNQGFVSKICQVGGYGWALALNGSDNKFCFMIYALGSSPAPGYELIYSDTAITSSAWHHVAATRNGVDTKTSILYVDGVAQADTMTRTLAECNEGLTISKWFSDGVVANRHTLSGSIDEVALWDRVLPASSILSLYNSGSGTRADSIEPPPAGLDDGDWSMGTNKKIGTYGIGPFNGNPSPAAWVSASWDSQIDFDYRDSFSWSVWVKPDSTDVGSSVAGNGAPLITKENYPPACSGDFRGFGLAILGVTSYGSPPAGNLSIMAVGNLNAAGNRGYQILYTDLATPLIADQWYHIVLAHSGAAGSGASQTGSTTDYKIYIDGYEIGAGEYDPYLDQPFQPSPVNPMTGRPLYFGYRQNCYARIFHGYLDDIAIFDVELDSGAVLDLYNSGSVDVGALASNVSSSALKGYWDFENPGPGSTTISGSRGLDATMMGSMDGGNSGTPGSLLLYYDFEIGDNNPVSGNFPTSRTIYDVDTVAWKSPTMHTGTMTLSMEVADFGAWGQGKMGKYSFLADGADDSLSIPSSSYLPRGDGNESFSISLWANNTAPLNSYETLVGRHQTNAAAYAFNSGYNLGYDGNGSDNLTLFIGEWDSGGSHASCPWVGATDTTFRHIVATYNKDTDVSQLWLDGVKQTDGTKSTVDPQPGLVDTRIGVLGDNTGYSWPGNIDEVAFYNVVLDSGDISDLYNSGQGAKASTVRSSALVCYLDMECDGPGFTNVLDLSGNDLSGTLDADAGTCGAG